MTDPLDDFLDRGFSCEANESLQVALRQQTTRVLHRQRQMRRLVIAGMAAACYAAGLATMWLLVPRTVATTDLVPQHVVIVERIATPPHLEEKLPESAAIQEKEALAKPEQRATLLRRAGDLYLEKEQDIAAALRCYTQAFAAVGPEALEFSPEDNWLVMAIKNARRKERMNVH